ncbi:MAG: PDZ domain-containing protein, partial [Bacteroidales bacterium]|nr:PDZ domain-containing protein [Bacteroidales bacterium]
MMVDLGASHAVLVETDRAGSPPMPARTIEAVIGRGLSGNISGNVGRFARLDWCGFSFEDVVTSFTGEYASGMDDTTVQRNGTLGGDILSRFTLILDYKGGKIFLKKNSRYRRPFEFNLSGLDLIATEPDWRTVVVSGVIAHSPADEAGVLAGDFIISVNGVPVGSLSLGRINSLMHSKPDRKITLKISREHQVMKKTFRLRRMI